MQSIYPRFRLECITLKAEKTCAQVIVKKENQLFISGL